MDIVVTDITNLLLGFDFLDNFGLVIDRYIQDEVNKFEVKVKSATCFGLVVFYGISTLVGYLMPNPVYIYIY